MPTGYTAKINEGKEVGAREFLLDCSRAFGALIMMRDAPIDAEIPEKFEPNMYAKKQTEILQTELARRKSLTEEEALAELEQWYQNECAREFNAYNQSLELAQRYRKLIDQVELWQPPTPEHEGLKQFSLKQLVDSLEADCRRALTPYVNPEKPVLNTWITDRIDGIKREIAYYQDNHREEEQRTSQRNDWIKQLRESLETLP